MLFYSSHCTIAFHVNYNVNACEGMRMWESDGLAESTKRSIVPLFQGKDEQVLSDNSPCLWGCREDSPG
jgi:hypothetical protein